METLLTLVFLILGVVIFAQRLDRKARRFERNVRRTFASPRKQSAPGRAATTAPPQKPVTSAPFNAEKAHPAEPHTEVSGPAYVVDGDTIKIKKTQIRLFGIDAPEPNHPHGKKAKWELVGLCKGQTVRAVITDEDDHGRTVAKCYLPDGRDLSAEMVKAGLAIDWPKFSGGKYRPLEVENARKKMWLADARQKGRIHVWEQYEARKKAQKEGASGTPN
ncbi:thermonuclease family protein [Aliiroseovarius sp. Z3]|uniref:thermonuclease family protein n=1 Tax=Aliiroseovarius sp. Z3 TaxID=2811402 RepID=UPI0023B22839|nr:thermonuclease family protein [Aliiroseovarius sp. Z3]MDE9449672.1 thermonuclease family protein [Aliiroseovarius sp. Z3]